jgi:hypothetical protein
VSAGAKCERKSNKKHIVILFREKKVAAVKCDARNFYPRKFFLVLLSLKSFHRRSGNISTSTSHPMLNFNNNNSNSSRNLFSSSSRGQTHDKSTQTPENIERETRRHKLRSLKINFNNVPTPSLNFKLSFLNQRKRQNLSAKQAKS